MIKGMKNIAKGIFTATKEITWEVRNIEIYSKSGVKPRYEITGNIVVSITTVHLNPFIEDKVKTIASDFMYNTLHKVHSDSWSKVDYKNTVTFESDEINSLVYVFCKRVREIRSDGSNNALRQRICDLAKDIKSEDECCVSPELVRADWYYKHDILLAYMLNDSNFKVLNYDFKGISGKQYDDSPVFIDYEYKGFCLDYLFQYRSYRSKFLYEYACFNCNKCVNTDIENFLNEFQTELKCDLKLLKSKEKARRICQESDKCC